MNCLEFRELIVTTSKNRELTDKEKTDKRRHLESCKEYNYWQIWLEKKRKAETPQ